MKRGELVTEDPSRADRRARARNTKSSPGRRRGDREDRWEYPGRKVEMVEPLARSKPSHKEWRRNTYFIHIHPAIRSETSLNSSYVKCERADTRVPLCSYVRNVEQRGIRATAIEHCDVSAPAPCISISGSIGALTTRQRGFPVCDLSVSIITMSPART